MAEEMSIKGFLPTSFIDWPGKIAAVIFIGGCNFRCGYCHNPELVRNEGDEYPLDVIIQSIERRKDFLTGIVITGGEPTIWEGIYDLCDNLHSFRLPIKLDTNGSNPPVLARLSEGYVASVAMDVKCLPEYYPIWHSCITRSINMLNKSIPVQFRTTAIPGLVEEPEIREIRKLLKKPHTVQFFSPGNCLDPEFNKITPFTPERVDAMRREFNND